jgi:type I restriction enzyme, S subunit
MYWILSSNVFTSFIDLNKNGTTILHLYQNVFERFYYSVPSLSEQTTIAKYLDSDKTSAIDRKIKLLTAKTDKYKALRRSLINETVCRGLNPNVQLKDSGIEWIGMIPEHWEVKRFKDIAYSITGLTYSPDDIVDEGEGVLVLRSGNIQNGELSFNDNVFVNSNIGKNLFVRKGDILLCSRNGSANLVGKSAYIDKNYNYTWGAFMTVARSKMGRFLFYALNSDLFKRNMGLFQTSTVNQLTSKMLDNMAFIVPTKEEQIEIVDYLDTKTTKIDTILTNISEQFNKLKLLRKTLINDVVTGKIKVTED